MTATTLDKEEEIDSVAAFIAKVADWYVGQDDILFRGHRVNSWPLIPRLGRMSPRVRFADSPTEVEKKLLKDFDRLAVPYIGARHLQIWDRLALAQHHGLPTRLLDWSSNPLVALWFAVERPPGQSSAAAVWAYRASSEDFVDHRVAPADISRTMIFRPDHHDERIVAQAGWFSVHKYSESTQRFSALENVKKQQQKLRKFVVPAKYFPAVRGDLARCGITRASLFPDLAGLCGYLSWKYEPLEDEGPYDINNYL